MPEPIHIQTIEPDPEQQRLAQQLADEQRRALQACAIPRHILNAPSERCTYDELRMRR